MLEKRKAQGLPLRFIILAVLALVVIIVVITIYFQENEKISGSLESCASKGGICKKTVDCSSEKIISGDYCGTGMVCCAQI